MNLKPENLRRHILKMAYSGQSVHIGCAFSLVEIVSVLYSDILHYSPERADAEDRDLVVLSKGHGVMALYAIHRELGWIGNEGIEDYFSDGSALHGLCEANVPGLEVSSGSLGHGLPVAVGMALGLRMKGSERKVYCIVGDGELNEGSMWESLLFAGHHQLENLVVIVDFNKFQAMGRVHEIIQLEPLAQKFSAFGFTTIECDGHSMAELKEALSQAPEKKPLALIAHTVKGKGISFMEDKNEWHYSRLSHELYEKCLGELKSGELS